MATQDKRRECDPDHTGNGPVNRWFFPLNSFDTETAEKNSFIFMKFFKLSYVQAVFGSLALTCEGWFSRAV